MKRKLSGCLMMATFLFGLYLFTGQTEALEQNTALPGITIDEIDVSGMTQQQIADAVGKKIEGQKEQSVTLDCAGNGQVVVSAGELGLSWGNSEIASEIVSLGRSGNIVNRYKAKKDIEIMGQNYAISYVFDKAKIGAVISEKCTVYDQEAINGTMKMIDGQFQIVDGQIGYKLDEAASIDTVYSTLLSSWNGNPCEIALSVEVDEPQGQHEELMQVKDVLGEYSTSYKTSGSSRSKNVENGCNLINGTILYPGDEFSAYQTISPFSVENGYYLAGSYLNGQVVESLGGGICQVSTTLYNAVLLAELEVTERHNHSMIVGYVSPSADAAISESAGKDFKFKNNTDHPIYIEGHCEEKRIYFTIYGVESRDPGHSVSYESEVLERTEPEGELVYTDAGMAAGTHTSIQAAHIGYKARLWKIVKENDVEVSRELVNNSTYNKAPRSVTIGVATDNPEIYNALMAAAASGSADVAVATANSIAAGQTPAAAPAPEQQQEQAPPEE